MRGTGISRFGSRVGLAVLMVLLLGGLGAAGCGAGGEDTTTTTMLIPGPGEQSTTTASSVPTGPSDTTPATLEAVTTTTTEPTTTTTELTTTTTELTTTTTGVQVTHESGESACYIKKIYSTGGKNYIVVDYIQLTWDEESQPSITNSNPRLRTFEIPKTAWIGFHGLAVTLGLAEYEQPGVRGTFADLKRGFRLTQFWWDIKVSNGKVISIVEGWTS